MHCVSAYPCNLENINFPRLEKLKELSSEVGIVDTIQGIDDALAAMTLGATILKNILQ